PASGEKDRENVRHQIHLSPMNHASRRPLAPLAGRGWRAAPGEGRFLQDGAPHPPFGHLLPARGEKDLENVRHQIHLSAMNHTSSTMLITASGRKTFQPTFIRMSYLSRGIVQRTQTKTNNTKPTLAM